MSVIDRERNSRHLLLSISAERKATNWKFSPKPTLTIQFVGSHEAIKTEQRLLSQGSSSIFHVNRCPETTTNDSENSPVWRILT